MINKIWLLNLYVTMQKSQLCTFWSLDVSLIVSRVFNYILSNQLKRCTEASVKDLDRLCCCCCLTCRKQCRAASSAVSLVSLRLQPQDHVTDLQRRCRLVITRPERGAVRRALLCSKTWTVENTESQSVSRVQCLVCSHLSSWWRKSACSMTAD